MYVVANINLYEKITGAITVIKYMTLFNSCIGDTIMIL